MIPQTNNAHTWFGTFSISEVIWLVVWGIVHIVLAIGLLSGAGAVSKKKIHIICSWIMLIIVGLVIVLPTANWGGVIVVIAGVIGIFDRLD
jgi:glucan phosphoethanolaminetransferase (alkaline phosphatase superfamily)